MTGVFLLPLPPLPILLPSIVREAKRNAVKYDTFVQDRRHVLEPIRETSLNITIGLGLLGDLLGGRSPFVCHERDVFVCPL